MQAASHLMVAIGTGAGAETGALAGRPSVRRYSQRHRRIVMMKLGIDVERHGCLEPNLHKDGR
jgi:hypothetical protein